MEQNDKEEIIKAIGKLEKKIAVLQEKEEHMRDYISNDLKPDIEKLCEKVENCMANAEECYQRNVKWMAATIVSAIIALFGWGAWLIGVVK
jgi:uncharacterized membrane protein (DUF106 family)